MNLSLTHIDSYSKLYCDRPTASTGGTVDEDKGCSLSARTTFGLVGGRTTLASDPVSTPSVGWMMSSWRMPLAMLTR